MCKGYKLEGMLEQLLIVRKPVAPHGLDALCIEDGLISKKLLLNAHVAFLRLEYGSHIDLHRNVNTHIALTIRELRKD